MVKLPTASRDAACNALVDQIDAAGAGELRILTGSPPAITSADTGDLLSTIDFDNPAMGNSSSGVAALAGSPPEDAGGTAAGTAGYFRIYTNAGATRLLQGTVGLSAADMIIDDVVFVASGTATLASLAATVPEGS